MTQHYNSGYISHLYFHIAYLCLTLQILKSPEFSELIAANAVACVLRLKWVISGQVLYSFQIENEPYKQMSIWFQSDKQFHIENCLSLNLFSFFLLLIFFRKYL